MPERTIIVHLQIRLPDGDESGPDEVGDSILAAIEKGMGFLEGDLASGNGAAISVRHSEEVV